MNDILEDKVKKKKFIKRIRLTPICIFLLILIFLAFITAINGIFINNEGGASLGGGIALAFFLILMGILYIEQFIINILKTPIKKIWIIETVLIVILILTIYLRNIDLSVG